MQNSWDVLYMEAAVSFIDPMLTWHLQSKASIIPIIIGKNIGSQPKYN